MRTWICSRYLVSMTGIMKGRIGEDKEKDENENNNEADGKEE